ncbi:probable E3 ubiquitin-protein ligase XERICO [Impatiens glandulifera]|uniref:probable E3 ubiquitin-protein ligase XERICO n=1 Tax=Impatiens glandulifera TaxID=253017 RepID=UPI001FB08518|nr:probable E3 ubiquitin-protein ligase XERICO [Impatiens glandulifera]
MGLSTYPTPADGGVLCVVLVSTIMSINMLKGLINSMLRRMGMQTEFFEVMDNVGFGPCLLLADCQSKSFLEQFRSKNRAIRFGSIRSGDDHQLECSVCLIEFERRAMINKLGCGHVFHKACMEKWVDGYNISCPLCRSRF